MRKNRFKICITIEFRADNNHFDIITDIFENETLYNSIKAKDLLKYLDILNNQY